jgi:hypothetical protein
MKKVPLTVVFVTIYAIVFQVSFFEGVSDAVIFALSSFSPFLVLYMAYVILKYGKPSGYSFDEKFYDDYDYWRNGKESMGE